MKLFELLPLIDDITTADCELLCTEDLSQRSLVRTLEEMYGSIENSLK